MSAEERKKVIKVSPKIHYFCTSGGFRANTTLILARKKNSSMAKQVHCLSSILWRAIKYHGQIIGQPMTFITRISIYLGTY